jgi:hypothetical protein
MGYEKYSYKDSFYHKNKTHFLGKKFLIFISFLFVFGIVFVTTFYEGFNLTGNFVDLVDINNSFEFKSYLSIQELILDDEYEEITIYLSKGSFINLDNKEISLDEIENEIILKDFKGKIKISESNLNYLNGKIAEVIVNNIPMISSKGGKIKIELFPDSEYSFFEIKEKIYLKKISFITSGNINFGTDSLNLNSEKITFENYLGSLMIENKKLILEGFVENLKIEGNNRKLILSK